MKKLLTIIMFSIICMGPAQAGICKNIRDLAGAALAGSATWIGICTAVKYGLVTIPGFHIEIGHD